MAINLKPPAKQSFTGTNPLQSFQNPVEDFLAPFKQQKTELEGKINEMTSAQAPNPMPQVTNEEQEKFLRDARYESAMQDPNVSGVTKFVWKVLHGIDNLTWGGVTETVQTMAETPASSPTEIVGSWAQWNADAANAIKNLWYGDMNPEREAKIKGYIRQKLSEWVDPEVIKQALAKAKSEGKLQWSWSDNPISGTLSSIVAAPFQWAAALFGWEAKYLEGTDALLEWRTAEGVAKMWQWVIWGTMWALWVATWFTPGGAAVNTVLNSDTVAEPMWKYIVDPTKKVTAFGQELAWMDPNSEASKSVQETMWMIGPIAAFGLGQKYVAPKVTEYTGKGIDYMKENSPTAKWVIEWTKDFASNTADYVNQKAAAIKEKATWYLDQAILDIDKGKKAGYQANPYVKEYFDRVTKEMESPEGLADIKNTTTNFITETVDALQPIIQSKRKALWEDSTVYAEIRKLPTQIDPTPIITDVQGILKKNGLSFDENGQVMRAPGSKWGTLNSADLAKINTILKDIIADADTNGGKLSVSQILDNRRNASEFAKYDATTTSDWMKVMRAIRAAIDKTAKTEVAWLREIDKNFVDKLEAFDNATRDLVYKQGENKGEFISNFNSKIKNLMNDRNSPLRGRLDEIMPELSARIEAINLIPELHRGFTKELWGKWSSPMAWGAAWYVMWGPLGAIGWFFFGASVQTLLGKVKVKRINAILSQVSEAGKARIDEINAKIKANENLTKADADFLKDLKAKIEEAFVREKIIPKDSVKMLPSGEWKTPSAVNVKWEVIAEDGTIPLKASDAEVISGSKKDIQNAKIDTQKPKPEAQRLLPAPRTPEWTTIPRTDIVAESMQANKAKRPEFDSSKKSIIPKKQASLDVDNELIEEARKYKSADEFLKAQWEILYRWWVSEWTSFTTQKRIAEDFAKYRWWTVKEYIISKNAKIADYNDFPDRVYKNTDNFEMWLDAKKDKLSFMENELESEFQRVTKWAKQNWYDAINLPVEDELRIINKWVIIEKQAIMEIYESSKQFKPPQSSLTLSTEIIPKKKEKYRTADDLNNTQLTTKILKWLGDRETVSKEFIMNLTNSGDVKQIEKDIIRTLLETEGDKINVPEFKRKVESELLPLKVVTPELWMGDIDNETGEFLNARYERVTLPPEIRGNILNYREKIYESPIDTEAGNIHFEGDTKNYFWHTRVEDMADGSTRRVIEVQSDLFQKGNLEKEMFERNNAWRVLKSYIEKYWEKEWKAKLLEDKWPWMNDFDNKMTIEKYDEAKKLSQYNDPTAHFRMIREEVSKAVEDGKTKLQFPTGETAMKIEGLGNRNNWSTLDADGRMKTLVPEELSIGKEITDWHLWIITDVLWDGKFKAIPKREYEFALWAHMDTKISSSSPYKTVWDMPDDVRLKWIADRISSFNETFDISWDQNNPIYKFYEKEVGRYLKNKYDAKLVTDDKGISWYQVDVKDSMWWAIEAFRSWKTIETSKMTTTQKMEILALNKKFFWDDSVQIVEKIQSNIEALWSYKDGIIKVVDWKGNAIDTFHHEAVHKYLDVFATKDEAAAILEYWKNKYKNNDFVSVEEVIAEAFVKFAKDRTGVIWKIRIIFENIINRIQEYIWNADKINQMYRDILQGKIKKRILPKKMPTAEKMRRTTSPEVDHYMKENSWNIVILEEYKKQIIPRWNKSQKDLTFQEESSKMDSPSKKTTMSEQSVNNNWVFYHWTSKSAAKNIEKWWYIIQWTPSMFKGYFDKEFEWQNWFVSLSSTEKLAKWYAWSKWVVLENKISKDANIVEFKDMPKDSKNRIEEISKLFQLKPSEWESRWFSRPKLMAEVNWILERYAKENDVDGIRFDETLSQQIIEPGELRVYNPNILSVTKRNQFKKEIIPRPKKTTMSEQDLLDKMNSEYFDSLKDPADKNLMTAELSKGTPLYEIIAKINKSKSSKKEILPKKMPTAEEMKKAAFPEKYSQTDLSKEAQTLSKESFIAKYRAEPSWKELRELSDKQLDWLKLFEDKHWIANIKDLNPSEYDNFADIATKEGWTSIWKESRQKIDQMAKFLKENPTKDLPPVFIDASPITHLPNVIDWHHRTQAYIEAWRSKIPYQIDTRWLELFWEKFNKKGSWKKQIIPRWNKGQEELDSILWVSIRKKVVDDFNKKAEEFYKQKETWNLSPGEYSAIKSYTYHNGDFYNHYYPQNYIPREASKQANWDSLEWVLYNLKNWLSKLPSYTWIVTRWSSWMRISNMKIWETYAPEGLLSATKGDKVHNTWSDSKVLLKIKSKTWKDIDSISSLKGENEIIFNYWTKFNIKDIKEELWRKVFYLEEI